MFDAITANRRGTDRELLGAAVQKGDEWFVDGHNTYTWHRAIATTVRPSRVLELGIRYGYAGVALLQGSIAAGIAAPRYVGVDSEADGIPSNSIALRNLKSIDPTARILKVDTLDVKQVNVELMKLRKVYDVVHVDGCHSVEGVQAELKIAETWARRDGFILIDDIDTSHIRDAAVAFGRNVGVLPIVLPTQHGLAVIDMRKRTVYEIQSRDSR